ncbi:MGH1-like glycoside hydrolase domain-containing protein [Paenibacillus ginsengarvi]|nr:trehalase family glycosidase [Paenibacillus ginsengarvi]
MIQEETKWKETGKPAWQPLLQYTWELHQRSVRPAVAPFRYDWEEIGPGYCYGPAFGHWDLIHALFDRLPTHQDHAKKQFLNYLGFQGENGVLPGTIIMRDGNAKWNMELSHPPVWPVALDEYVRQYADNDLLHTGYNALQRQIGWFESERKAPFGYYYMDIMTRKWESGVDDGIRFDQAPRHPSACVDATSHVYQLYTYAAQWARQLGSDPEPFVQRSEELKLAIQQQLYDEQTGFFYDSWTMAQSGPKPGAQEGMWPLVVGAATPQQANRVIDEHLLNPKRFFTKHPLATVAVSDPAFELRMWRGPVWNSMTYWAARGCMHYNRFDAALQLLEGALDASAEQFAQTGAIWEFYHPHGEAPDSLTRKPYTAFNTPCRDYLGHNPFLAMARLWQHLKFQS